MPNRPCPIPCFLSLPGYTDAHAINDKLGNDAWLEYAQFLPTPPDILIFSFYEATWTNAGSIGTDTSIVLAVILPAGWDAEGQRPMITYVSSNPQELCSLNQVVGDQLDFSVWNVSPSAVAVNVNRTIRILLA